VMEDERREKAGRNQLGTQRYLCYVAAFDHVMDCCECGYHLEAIAVLDSLIGDRLASRLSHLLDEEVLVRLTIGQLSRKLLDPPTKNASPAEVDSAFQAVIKDIRAWVKDRNRAMHAIAKIIRDDEDARHFDELLESHRSIVEKGIALLQTFDKLDTAARQENGKSPATWPYAFFPEKR
jgi:hypothetical protein